MSFDCCIDYDFKIIGRILSGLAQQGSWVCFRNLDRIAVEVLSVVAQQLLCLQQGSVKQCTGLDFQGKLIPLKASFGVFITITPGYAGRNHLPDNLKSIFRPVAVTLPDCRVISEVLLYVEGFKKATLLASKVTHLYSLCSELLTEQPQYNFGIRAVKAALAATIQLKTREPDTNEETLFLRAVRDSTVPMLIEQDALLLTDILSSMFPGVKVAQSFYFILFDTISLHTISLLFVLYPSTSFFLPFIMPYSFSLYICITLSPLLLPLLLLLPLSFSFFYNLSHLSVCSSICPSICPSLRYPTRTITSCS